MYINLLTFFRHLFLSCISLGTANTRTALQKVASMTLLSVQQEKLEVDVKTITDCVIRDLFKLGALKIFNETTVKKGTKDSYSTVSNVSVCLDTSIVSCFKFPTPNLIVVVNLLLHQHFRYHQLQVDLVML